MENEHEAANTRQDIAFHPQGSEWIRIISEEPSYLRRTMYEGPGSLPSWAMELRIPFVYESELHTHTKKDLTVCQGCIGGWTHVTPTAAEEKKRPALLCTVRVPSYPVRRERIASRRSSTTHTCGCGCLLYTSPSPRD